MLELVLGEEGFNDETQTFETVDPVVLHLEHSLVSLSKWESKYQKPFLSSEKKSAEEWLDYVVAMVTDDDFDQTVLDRLSDNDVDRIQKYVDSPQSATTFGTTVPRKVREETITAELVYYWMLSFGIPFECQYWHLNRLFSLIRICGIKNSKPKTMSRHEMAVMRNELNRKRREALGTTG